jgi:surface protein
MGILKTITEEYFGETEREEDKINIEGIDAEIVSFTDNNKKFHKTGYKPKNLKSLRKLLKRMIEVRGDEGDFNDIDTSNIKSMESLFEDNNAFNGDITGWDVSNVMVMDSMFYGAKSFNQPIGDWKVSSVRYMNKMFFNATSFNQDLSEWNLIKKYTDDMFINCPIKDEYKPKMKYKPKME